MCYKKVFWFGIHENFLAPNQTQLLTVADAWWNVGRILRAPRGYEKLKVFFLCVRNAIKPMFSEVVSYRWGLGQVSPCVAEDPAVLSGVRDH